MAAGPAVGPPGAGRPAETAGLAIADPEPPGLGDPGPSAEAAGVVVGAQPASDSSTAAVTTVRGRSGSDIGSMLGHGGVELGASLRVMDAFELDDVLAARAATGRLYHEFLRTHDLSVGVYALPAGGVDPQGPHTEDEVYHVVSGRARIRVGDEDRAVQAGSVVFVGADIEHRFHDIEEELVILVMFGPAEYTHRADHQGGRPHGAAPG